MFAHLSISIGAHALHPRGATVSMQLLLLLKFRQKSQTLTGLASTMELKDGAQYIVMIYKYEGSHGLGVSVSAASDGAHGFHSSNVFDFSANGRS